MKDGHKTFTVEKHFYIKCKLHSFMLSSFRVQIKYYKTQTFVNGISKIYTAKVPELNWNVTGSSRHLRQLNLISTVLAPNDQTSFPQVLGELEEMF